MRLRDDERAQSVQIGAVLLFAVLVIAFSSYQAFVVPNQNRAIEFNHNEQIRNQMQDLRNELVSIHGEPSTSSVSLILGTQYPGRLVAVNPGPPSGTIRTAGTGPTAVNLTLANAEATGETGDFWNGTERSYNTGALVYQPNYNVYGGAPQTVYEQSVLYNQFRASNLTASGQTLIDDERISLVTVNGSLSQTRTGSTSLDLQPVSTSTTTVSVSNASATENVTLAVATQLPKSRWTTLLDAQLDENGGHVVDHGVDTISGSPFDRLWIELEPGVDYRLRMTKVGVGTDVTDEQRAYLTDVVGNGTLLDVDDTTTVTLEVRDAYNNPIADAQVNASTGTGALSPQQARTDEDGAVTFTYDSTGVTGGQWVDLDFSVVTDPGTPFDASTPQNVTMQVRVQSPPPASGGGGGGVYTTQWNRPPYSSERVASEQLPAGTGPSVPFRMQATDGGPPVANAEVDYAVNDSTVATFTNETGRTDASGYNQTAIRWQGDGYLRAYTTTDATGDRVNVTVDRVLAESFEDPSETLVANGWYYNDSDNPGAGAAGIKNIGSAPDGSRIAYINGSSGASAGDRAVELNYSLNTSDYDGLSITYVAREPSSVDDPDVPGSGGYDPGENLYVQYRAADGSWVTVDNVSSRADSGLPVSSVRRATIENVANASHDDFALRFRQGATTATDEWQVDDVTLVGLAVEDRVADLNQDPIADFRDSPTNPTTADTVSFDAARADDPDGSISSYDWEFGDGSTANGRTATNDYGSAGSYDVTLTVTDDGGETNTTTRTVSVSGATGGFQDVGAVNLLPSTMGQNQSFTFTPDADIPGDTDVTITLDDPQQVSPRQVDYQGSAGTTIGSVPNKNKNADTATVTWRAPSGGVSAGQQVRVWVNSIKTGSDAQQTDPYDVTFTRADSGATATAAFSVGQNTGGSELTNLAADDLDANTNSQTQTIQFEPTTPVPAGEEISISLVDPQSSGDVNYQGSIGNSNVNINVADASYTDQNSDNASIRLRADSSGIAANTLVEIDVSGVNTGTMDAAPYEVGFSRGDAGTASTTFGESFLVPTLSTRVDDLSDDAQDRPRLIGSYDVSNTNSSFTRVETSFIHPSDSSASQTYQNTTTRAGAQYTNNYGTETTYDITFDVVYTVNGVERVVTSETISDTPDGSDPAGNTDLGDGGSAQFTSSTIQDRSSNSAGPRYRFDYAVGSGSFRDVVAGVVSINDNNGATEVQTGLSQTDDRVITPGGGGLNTPYRPVIVVRDANGAVVDQRELIDTADGTTAGNSQTAVQVGVSNFEADNPQDEFTVQAQGQDQDGDTDMDRLEYVVFDSSGAVVATATRTGSGQQIQPGQITISGTVQGGETYTVIVTGYDTDGNYDWESLSDTSDTYNIVSVSPTPAGSGNNIDVTFEIDTTDSNAQVEVISLEPDGSERDSTGLTQVNSGQSQTETVKGAGQADRVRVILYDGNGVEAARQTVQYNG